MRSYFLCVAMLAMGFGLGPSAAAAADPPSRPQVPPTTANGGSNLTHHWIEDGGARIYWNTLNDPRQIRMGGARFSDPASVPPLLFDNSCCEDKRKGTGRGKAGRKAAPAKNAGAAKPAAVQQAPAGVGANKLKKPETPAAATPPSGKAGGNVRAAGRGGGSGARASGAKGLVPTTYTNLETPKVTPPPTPTPPVVAPMPQVSSPMPPLIPAPSSPSSVDAAGAPAPPANPSIPVMRVDGNS